MKFVPTLSTPTLIGLFPEVAAASCKDIAEIKSDYHSGYYWITGPAGPVGVYCEMHTPFEQDYKDNR